jgi:Glycosyl transferases group 1/Glycosyltransferase Family 4
VRTLHVDTGREMRGGQWQVLYLLQGLTDAVLLTRARSPLRAHADACGIDVRPLSIPGLADAARHADVIHAHDARAHTLAAMIPGVPVIVSRRVAFPIKSGVLSAWKYTRPSLFLAVSKFVAERVTEAGVPAEKIRVVYDGVPLPEGGRPQPGRVVALASKPVQIPGISVDLTHNLWEDLRTASVFVYSSELEGLGSAALAAMAAGVAVVASAVGGLPEAVVHGRTGFLVTDGDFATPVRRLLDDPQLAAALGRAGRERVEGEFSVDAMVKNTQRSYAEVTR